jgi:hypothetical protein
MKPAILLVSLLALATPAAAQQGPAFGEIGYGGTGCPDGTALVSPGLGNGSVALQLSDYAVGDNGRGVDRKTCALALPVDVPEGMAVAIRLIGLQGTAKLPADIEATLSIEAFTAGDSGEVTEFPLVGPLDVSFFRFLQIPDDKLVWSGCGTDTNLRLNTSLRSKGNANAAVALTGLSVYRIATKPC